MQTIKELNKVIELLEGREELYTIENANKILIEEGSILFNKNSMYDLTILEDEIYNNCDLDEVLNILQSY